MYGDDGAPLGDSQAGEEYAHGQPSAYESSAPPNEQLYSPLQTFGSQEWYALAQRQQQQQQQQGWSPQGNFKPAVGAYSYGSPSVGVGGYYPSSPAASFSPHSRIDSGFGSQFASPEVGGQPFAGAYGNPEFGGRSRGPSARGYPIAPQHHQHHRGGPRGVPQPLPSRPPGLPPSQGQPPSHLARGQLAQAKLHGTLGQPTPPATGPARKREQPSGASAKPGTGGRTAALPKPPSHSPHALWVGNVPSDSTPDELEAFFTSRPPPAASGEFEPRPQGVPEGVDLESHGVESVHLIAR